MSLAPVGKKGVIKIGDVIGEGTRSIVFRGIFDDREVAVKRINFSKELNKELEILRNVEHQHVIKYLYKDEDEVSLFIALEHCPCSLVNYVGKKSGPEIPLIPVEVLKQITDGLDYLHNGMFAKSIVHRDLKPSNILFGRNGTVKISDFGISKSIPAERTSVTTGIKGSRGYFAPELLKVKREENVSGKIKTSLLKASDIFSLGVVFYYTLTGGKHPFGDDELALDKKIRDDAPAVLNDLKEDDYVNAGALILSMLIHDWTKRIGIKGVKSHHLFWEPEEKLKFAQDASDYLEDRGKHQELIKKLEDNVDEATGEGWTETLCDSGDHEITRLVKKELDKKKYKNRKLGVQDLLRQIRNWSHHYNDKNTQEKFRQEVGSMPVGFMNYFTDKFPKLIPHTYEILESQPQLIKYYSRSCKREAADLTPCCSISAEEKAPDDSSHKADSDTELLETSSGDEKSKDGDGIICELELRSYQKELAQQAVAGQNSMIIAPTGSGKTAVATRIIQKHIESRKSRCILFLVSKTTLARQQHDFFKRYFGEDNIAYLIGQNAEMSPAGATIKSTKLTVMTPKILINELKKAMSFITFDDISMMIFDECHNATKQHPYKEVMDMLLDFQHDHPDHKPVQIVGMTASPGVGKGKDRENVLENLVTLMANLNIKLYPSVVVENLEELKKYQTKIEEAYIKVHVANDKFSKKIHKAMSLIEERIREKGVLGKKPGQIREPPEDKTKQMYESWAVDVMKHARLYIKDQTDMRIVVTYAEHLRMYYSLLYLKRHIPNAIEVINVKMNLDQSGDEATFLRQINKELTNASKESKVPMLKKLLEIPAGEFSANGNSRCIIFVPRKLIATSLVECIKEHENLAWLQPKYLTGANDHSDSGGMTRAKQEATLQSFRDGKCKVLIATSVAEEGLDIRACNLVLMYNYVTGEVGRIQRAGRGREQKSRSLLITPVDSEHIKRERTNAICAMASEIAIQDLKELSLQQLELRIQKIQKSQKKDRRSAKVKLQRKIDEATMWKIFCGGCGQFLTTAENLRHIRHQHIVLVDLEFQNHVVRSAAMGEQKEHPPGFPVTGEYYCKNPNCKKRLGTEMRYKSDMYPSLTVDALLFEKTNGEKVTVPQWNMCPFVVEREINESEDEEGASNASEQRAVSTKKPEGDGGVLLEKLSEDEAKDWMWVSSCSSLT